MGNLGICPGALEPRGALCDWVYIYIFFFPHGHGRQSGLYCDRTTPARVGRRSGLYRDRAWCPGAPGVTDIYIYIYIFFFLLLYFKHQAV